MMKLQDIYNELFRHFGPQHWWPGDSPFEIAVGAVLTQNTNWSNVEKAIRSIRDAGALDAKTLHEMPHSKRASLIRPAGYFNIKARRLDNFLVFLLNHYKGSMKRMAAEEISVIREALLDVNGIGPETADSIILYALEKPVFVIDAYTKRVLSRHGLASAEEDYQELQSIFHSNLPMDVQLFNEFHALFVMTGKHFCKPRPKCAGCPLEGF